jgi:hypothetical protein
MKKSLYLIAKGTLWSGGRKKGLSIWGMSAVIGNF